MEVRLMGSAELRDSVMRSTQIWEHLDRFGIGKADVVGQVELWKEDPVESCDVIIGPMVYSYAAKVRIAVYVKSNSQRGTWREGRDRADDMYVEGLYRVHARELVTADSVGPEDRLVMTRHESLKQLYIERGLRAQLNISLQEAWTGRWPKENTSLAFALRTSRIGRSRSPRSKYRCRYPF